MQVAHEVTLTVCRWCPCSPKFLLMRMIQVQCCVAFLYSHGSSLHVPSNCVAKNCSCLKPLNRPPSSSGECTARKRLKSKLWLQIRTPIWHWAIPPLSGTPRGKTFLTGQLNRTTEQDCDNGCIERLVRSSQMSHCVGKFLAIPVAGVSQLL